MNRKINWFGLSAGITTLIVLATSLYMPWWQLTVGQSLIKVNASPVNTNFGMFGTQFTVPLLFALNVACVLGLVACSLVMLVYSIIPTNTHAKQLLGFSYKKPLYIVISFIVSLIIITVAAGYFGLTVPIMGSATMTLPPNWTMGANISFIVNGSFGLPFWLAIVAAALSLAARMYHSRLTSSLEKRVETTKPTGNPATKYETVVNDGRTDARVF